MQLCLLAQDYLLVSFQEIKGLQPLNLEFTYPLINNLTLYKIQALGLCLLRVYLLS